MSENEKRRKFPTIVELCLQTPLYETYSFSEEEADCLREIRYFTGNFDSFCIECGQTSVFQAQNTTRDLGSTFFLVDCTFGHWFGCTRKAEHRLFFLFQIKNKTLTKIGQFPSMADLAEPDIQKYRPILPNESYREFSRAVGLVSHGIGIGSFVYLRRIFERLIEEAHSLARNSTNWNEERYSQSRMEEKIEFLTGHLPNFLVENRSLYAILSKGIHALTEQECLEAFPDVKLGIELILDEKISKKEMREKVERGRKRISRLRSKIREKEF